MLAEVQDHEKAINIFLLHTLNLSFPVVVFDDLSFGACLTKPFLFLSRWVVIGKLCVRFCPRWVNVWVQILFWKSVNICGTW